MKQAWNDLKSFITVITMLLFAYCILRQLEIPVELQNVVSVVVGFFLGSKIEKGTSDNDKEENQ